MVALTKTSKISLAGEVEVDELKFTEIPAIGDGNCVFNSAAIWYIDAVKRDAIKLEEAKQNTLLAAIVATREDLKQRLNLYRGLRSSASGRPYQDLADDLERFIKFTEGDFSYQALVNYISSNAKDRVTVAALHVALAPAFRRIGAELNHEALRAINSEPALMIDAARLMEDGVWAGHECVTPLLHDFFGVNVRCYDSRNKVVMDPPEDIPGALTVYLHHLPGHWNYLMPAAQKDGLAITLSELRPVFETSYGQKKDETRSLLALERSFASQFKEDKQLIKQELQEVTDVIKQASENLLALRDVKTDKQKAKYQALSDHHLRYTESILTSVRKNLHLTRKDIESIKKVTELEKQLLLGETEPKAAKAPADPQILEDERLARALQDAEVLAFLNNHYEVLSKGEKSLVPDAVVVPEAAPKNKAKL